MSHLYLHIPFCKQKCNYCNFHFSTLLKNRSEVVDAICTEMKMREKEFDFPLKTIYLGGGTPSILTAEELGQIFNQIHQLFTVDAKAEITLEANPDDLDSEKINQFKKMGINRLSLGVQSFFDVDLQLMQRAHNAQEAEKAIREIQDAGIDNITIDLIYGAPTTTDMMWEQNVKKAVDLGVPHISAYALTVEPRTILQHQIAKKKVSPIDEAKQKRQFEFLNEYLNAHQFVAYEISNFGKSGYFSQHNSAYWQGNHYVGIGPSAHSFGGNTRSWNVNNNTRYIRSIQSETLPQEIEELSPEDQINELTMIGLRTIYGIDLNKIKTFSPALQSQWQFLVQQKIRKKQLKLDNGYLKLNPEFKFFADGIASDLFLV